MNNLPFTRSCCRSIITTQPVYEARRNTMRNTPLTLTTSDIGHKPGPVVDSGDDGYLGRKLVITRDITARIPGIGILCFNQCDS